MHIILIIGWKGNSIVGSESRKQKLKNKLIHKSFVKCYYIPAKKRLFNRAFAVIPLRTPRPAGSACSQYRESTSVVRSTFLSAPRLQLFCQHKKQKISTLEMRSFLSYSLYATAFCTLKKTANTPPFFQTTSVYYEVMPVPFQYSFENIYTRPHLSFQLVRL